ncbi:MAG TPA: TRAP transporter substrate-binding protein DctP [Bacteroidota bacterium]|nr:TRAP transporter substrate-binding protein DctP [Bacteroidota bacterium]
MKRILPLLLWAALIAPALHAQQYLVKFATLAPEGSSPVKVMRDFDKAIREQSGGRVGFKIYAGGVAGDEKDVVRKIKLGQYNAAGFTGVGINEIAKKVRILDAPFLFKNHDEVDFIVDKFDKEFEQAIEEGGFVLLGWAEVGLVYIYSDMPVASADDLKKTKIWMWEGDPIAEAAFQAIGVSPIPLSITDVSTSLQTGMINTVYTPPYELVALSWYTRVKYMLGEPLANSQGAVLISKKMFDSMPKDLQDILLTNGKKYFRQLTLDSREENRKAITTLKEKGMTVIAPSKEVASQFEATGKKARQLLVGKLFSQEFLDQVESALHTYRQEHGR